ncbi:L,D-transpeptidase family protein [Bradymonas sediminis]|uniref:L,D-TPase catalytic domain-containing protein n=1 Tax=Bradymonas sediminis TaxID=1548548 RepID=A0A2Z4FHD9_9DELT|nr:L,D-transpeptidase family protein [Bradymonas sediminis]AWV88066.1 hypothetical protein DN745_01440 [Bradymonas sediminis]TDP77189.1 murein L,D-transpeptidase YcbB/YkuD [Bradymonas sediminis]
MQHEIARWHWSFKRGARALILCVLVGAGGGLIGCTEESGAEREMPAPVDHTRVFVEKLLPELDAQLRAQADAVATGSALQNYLEIEASHSWNTRVAGGIKYADLFARLYPEIGYHKAFAQSDGLTPRGAVVLETLLNSGRHDLAPEPYHVARIQTLVSELEKVSAQDPAWEPIKLSGEEANQLVNWIDQHKLDPKDPATRTKVLDALVGASVKDSVDKDELAAKKPAKKEGEEAKTKPPASSEFLATPIPRITETLHGYLGVFEASAKLTAELELRVADGALRYARDMKHFNLVRMDWRDFRDAGGSTAIIYARLEKTFNALREADADTTRTIFKELQPQHPQYERLLDARARYLGIAENGGWESVRPTTLALGARSARVMDLRTRLAAEGYLTLVSEEPAPVDAADSDAESAGADGSADVAAQPDAQPAPVDPDVVDQALLDAVKLYQETHQFNASTTSPDAGFWRSLNVPIARRIEQIELSIQRWRESQYEGEKDYIMVNIPDFHAEVFVDHEPQMRFRVVTGDNKRVCDPKTEKWTYPHATPIMMAELNHVIINPYWYVPQSIITNELEPKMKRDPDYLAKNGYEIVELNGRESIRQLPGPNNALGFVKFIFPNAGNIYMHDTPSKRYFDYPVRAFSHGCVRVHEPKKLAEFLLGNDPTAKKYDVDELIDSKRQRYVELEKKIPVFLEYKTVRVDDAGHVNFLADIYRKDRLRSITDPEERKQYEMCSPRRAKPAPAPPEAGDEHDTTLPEGVESDVGP